MSPSTATIIQALKAIGKENIEEIQLDVIRRHLSDDERRTILSETQHSSVWIHETVKRICSEKEAKDELRDERPNTKQTE